MPAKRPTIRVEDRLSNRAKKGVVAQIIGERVNLWVHGSANVYRNVEVLGGTPAQFLSIGQSVDIVWGDDGRPRVVTGDSSEYNHFIAAGVNVPVSPFNPFPRSLGSVVPSQTPVSTGKGGSFVLYDALGSNFKDSVNTLDRIAPDSGPATNASLRDFTSTDANEEFGNNSADQYVFSHTRYGSYPEGGYKFTRYNYLDGTSDVVQTAVVPDQGNIIGFVIKDKNTMFPIEAYVGSNSEKMRIWQVDFSQLTSTSLAEKDLSGAFLTGEYAKLYDIRHVGTALVPVSESRNLNILIGFQIKSPTDVYNRFFYYYRYMTFDCNTGVFSSVFGESYSDTDVTRGSSGARVIFTDLGDGYLVGAFSAGRSINWCDQLEQDVFDEALIINVPMSTVIHKRLPYLRQNDTPVNGVYTETVGDFQNSINDGSDLIPGGVLAPDYDNKCFYIGSVETEYVNDPHASHTLRDRIVRVDLLGGMLTTWHEGPPTIYETGPDETSYVPMNCGGASSKTRPVMVERRTSLVPGGSPTTIVHFRDCRSNASIMTVLLETGTDVIPVKNGDDVKDAIMVAFVTGTSGNYKVEVMRYCFTMTNGVTGSQYSMRSDIPFQSSYVPIVTLSGETVLVHGRSTWTTNETLSVIYRTDYDPTSTAPTVTSVTGSPSVNVQEIGGSVHVTVNPSGVRLDEWAEPFNTTDLNATTSRHGLLPALSGSADQFLAGDGTWSEIQANSSHLISRISTSGNPPQTYTCDEAGLVDAISDIADGDIIVVPQQVTVTSNVAFPTLNFTIIGSEVNKLNNYFSIGSLTFTGNCSISGSNLNDHTIKMKNVNFIIKDTEGTNLLLDITGGATTYLSLYDCFMVSQDHYTHITEQRYNRNIFLPQDKNGYLQIYAERCYIFATVHVYWTPPSGPFVYLAGGVVDDEGMGNAWGEFHECKLGKFISDGYEFELYSCVTLNSDDLENWKTMASVDIWGTFASWYTSGKRGSWEDDPGTLDSRHAEDVQNMNLNRATGGRRHLPLKNAIDGDFVRFNQATGYWELATEPLQLAEVVLKPTDTPLQNLEGAMYYNSSAKAIMVCTEST